MHITIYNLPIALQCRSYYFDLCREDRFIASLALEFAQGHVASESLNLNSSLSLKLYSFNGAILWRYCVTAVLQSLSLFFEQ